MKPVLTKDGGMRQVGWLGLRSVRFYPPTSARWRVVPVRAGLARWYFPRMVFLVVRVGVSRRLHIFEVDDLVETIGPDTVLHPMIGGNSLSMDGLVCMGRDFRTSMGLRRDLVDRYWNTDFTSTTMTLANHAVSAGAFLSAGKIDASEVLKQAFVVVACLSLTFFLLAYLL